MEFGGKALRALAVGWACALALAQAMASQPAGTLRADFAGVAASADAQDTAQWVVESGDNQGLPFAIVDKKDAKLFVFAADGRLLGATSALLGLASGDHSVPGIGDMAPSSIAPADRTTPAGRFASEPGRNLSGEDVVWVDYDAGLAIHRLRASPAHERRPQRLASDTPDDKRITLGCIVVPVAFYESVVGPALGHRDGVVYVLPETKPARAMFGADVQLGMRKP
jgi:hypothetical protein